MCTLHMLPILPRAIAVHKDDTRQASITSSSPSWWRSTMWTTLETRCWIFLLTLGLVLIQVESNVPDVRLSCCGSVGYRRLPRIKRCFEQKPREDCKQHAFLIVTKSGKQWCVSPAAKWLKDKMDKNKLKCPPDMSMWNTN
ncbi:uncharacterized protein LOC144040224 [Vanacampus margaritifer]